MPRWRDPSELFWDNQPTARHVYSGIAYIPETNELILACRRLWRYSLDQHKWIFRIIPGANSPSDTPGGLGEEAIAYYDQSRDQMLTLSCGSGGPWSNVFNFSTNQSLDWRMGLGCWLGLEWCHGLSLEQHCHHLQRSGAW